MMFGYRSAYKILTTVFLACWLIIPVDAQKQKKYTRQGNRNYSEGQFQDSEILYRRALDADPSFNKAIFNLGDALYRQEKYDEATDNFRQLSDSELNRETLARSYYNMANSLLKAGKVEESIEAYKNSLRNKPDNMEAKYNLAYAQDLLEQQQQEQQQQQDQDSEDKQDQQENQQSDSDNNKDQQNQDQQEEQQQQGENEDEQKQEQNQQQQMSKEDAERLLQALAENEKEVQEKVRKEKAARARVRTVKNW